ncbi:putative serine/threonine-protein phosphatase PP2A catalytic subunit-like isoform 1 [Capsicum annuum]|nr:putative serine/threonine-protein phosphatase PP2A catalytic subunit-like isoform 1 [Capsicum annuum]
MDCVKLVLFSMLYTFLCQLVFSSSLPHLCPKHQAHALIQFKLMFTINPNASVCYNPTTLSWNKSTDCCSWKGVHCEETTGQVIELDLACSGLQGKFHSNSSLFQLSKLKRLYLYFNNFSGSLISAKFGELSSLTHLDLSHSGFTGAQLRGVLPERVFHLSNLEHLKLSYNSLTGLIPSNVTGLQNLQFLFLRSNYLNRTIPSWIFSLPSLSLLSLSNNSFSGNIQEFKSKSLYSVDLKQNQLQGPIPKSLLDLQGLFSLRISQNNLSGQIASTVRNLKTLRVLDLGSNHLNGTIPHCLGEMSELAVLDLNNNCLSGIINTTFTTENELTIINLYGNNLQGKVPPSLINCRYLEFLDLGDNQLNDTFPSWLGGLPDLQILSLRSNKLYGPIKESRTDNVFAKIQVIDLSSNGFSGDLPVSLFEKFQAMKIVRENKVIINLSRNRFEGYLPSVIGDLIGLRTLNLSHNGLEGVIPASLHQLSILESLDLSSNKIGGEIPQQLVSLTSLEVLNLSHNHLVGCIPKGKQFDMFDNSSYQGNDGLRGLPLSKDCGGYDGVPQASTPVELDEEEEDLISWQAVLMCFGCGLVIGLSIIYIMLSSHYPSGFRGCTDCCLWNGVHCDEMKGQVIELDLLCSGLQGKFHSNSSLFQLSSLKRFDLSNNDFSGSLIPTKFVLSILTIDPYGLRLGPYNFEPLLGCIPKGKKFDTLEKSSYQGNDGLRGFPLSEDCGGDDGVPQAITPVELDDDEEEDSPMISWQAFLMGYGCGFISALHNIHNVVNTNSGMVFKDG